jgi:NAD+ kinase
MKKAVVVFAMKSKPESLEAKRALMEWLKGLTIPVIDASDSEGRITEASMADVRFGVVIGGDGTFLTLIRRLEKKDQFPLVGVNLGSLGFIMDIGRDEMIPAIKKILDGKATEVLRRLLQVELWRQEKCLESGIVCNDAVITKDARTTMLKFDVLVNGELLSYVRADGYIVATPTGSTAYSLSVGGPLLHPEVGGNVLVPICAHSLSARAVVIPQQMPLELVLRDFAGMVYMVYDGQISYEIKLGDCIKIKTADASLRLFRSPEQKWAEALRLKLKMD